MAVGLGVLSQNSLPGDALYGLKRFTESARLLISGSSLESQFAQRRIDEIASLMTLKRAEDVTFDGTLESANGTNWRVSGLTVTVATTTPGSFAVNVGDEIEVQGSTTTQGDLVARIITLIAKGKAMPTNTPTFTPSPTIMPSSTLTVTLSPTSTSSPTPTPSTTATLTPVPSTLAPSSTPTLRPLPVNTLVPTQNIPPANPSAAPPTDDHGGRGGGNDGPSGGSGSGSSGGGSGSGDSGSSGSGSDGSGHH
jgi:uncharacterized membrane protein YgcG